MIHKQVDKFKREYPYLFSGTNDFEKSLIFAFSEIETETTSKLKEEIREIQKQENLCSDVLKVLEILETKETKE